MAHLPQTSALVHELVGDRASWGTGEVLLARMSHQLAQANWQRGGGKGPRPRPIPVPEPRPRRSRDRGADTARRLHRLGLLADGQAPPQQPPTPQQRQVQRQLAAALAHARGQ